MGYYLPTKIAGPTNSALGLIDFPNLAAYEQYRARLLTDPDAVERLKTYTNALVEVGDNQDELAGELRWVVRAMRQKAGLLLAVDPRIAPVAAEVRTRTHEALRNPASHEGAPP